ncbi:SHOCT domain-containing protein [Chloroflexota bacterium]
MKDICAECKNNLQGSIYCNSCASKIIEDEKLGVVGQQQGGVRNSTIEATGVNGQLALIGEKIRISRKGAMSFLTQGLKGDKEILISQISSIQFKKAGMITNGYIQFAFVGGLESKGGIFNATQDENTIMFNVKQQPSFERLKTAVDEGIARQHIAPKETSSLDDLEKLASLRDRGIITEEEFNAKKRQILGI